MPLLVTVTVLVGYHFQVGIDRPQGAGIDNCFIFLGLVPNLIPWICYF